MATTVNPPAHERDDNNVLNNLFARALTLNWEVVVFTLILLVAVFTRFNDLGERIMSHDESLHTQYSYNLYTDGQFEHTPLMHGPILFHFTALSYYLFGDNDFSARIYTAVLGVLIVMSPLMFRRWLGRWGTIIAMLLLLASPLMMYYSRYIRHDMPSILSAIIMAGAALMYLSGPENQRRRAHWLYILSAAMIWNLGSKETAFIYIAIFGLFLTIYWFVRMGQYFFGWRGKPLFETIGIGMSLAVVFSLLMILAVTVGLGNVGVVGGETLTARLTFLGDQFGVLLSGEPVTTDFATFLSWTGLVIVLMILFLIGPALWVYRNREETTFAPTDGLMVVVTALLIFGLWNLISPAVAFIVTISLGLLYAAFRLQIQYPFARATLAVGGIILVLGGGLLIFEEISHEPSRTDATEVQEQPVPGQEGEGAESDSDFTLIPVIALWIGSAILIGGLLYSRRAGWWDTLHKFPELDVLIVMGSMILPWLTAFFIYMTNPNATAYADLASSLPAVVRDLIPTGAIGSGQELARAGRVFVGILAWIPMMAVAVITGLVWNWRRWLVCFAIFHVIFAFFFTTVFTNIEGLATGMIYSLEYWLEQQGVRRGSQPQYYYLLLIMPMYEFLPIIGSILAMLAGVGIYWRRRRARIEPEATSLAELNVDAQPLDLDAETSPAPAKVVEVDDDPFDGEDKAKRKRVDPRYWLDHVPFTLFVAWWAVMNLFGYTLSGEKMPWLGTHMTVPMIFLTAWYFGRIIDRIDVRTLLEKRGWLYFLLLPLGLVVGFQILAPFLGAETPFQGTTRTQLTWTYQWLAVVFVGGLVLYGIWYVICSTGWTTLRQMLAVAVIAVLTVVTFRSAWLASFINYDEATEFLVYAHAAPGNEIVYDTLRDLSIRTTGGMSLRFAYDDGMSWPGSWYFREFDNDLYYGSNPTLRQLEDVVAVAVRDDGRAEVEPLLEDRFQRFDYMRMWWPMQDYYGLNAGRVNNLFDLSDLSAAERRRGIFDIWWNRDYDRYAQAIGRPGAFNLTNWPVSDQVSLYIRKDIAAQVWQYGIGEGNVLNPFTAVEENVCLSNWQEIPAEIVFDTSQTQSIRPIGLDVTSDGRILVAQEGNTETGAGMQVSVYDTSGNFIESFGTRGTAGQVGAFFERPHSVAIGENGQIFVADTWNYLIRVFNQDFEQLRVWGQPFSAGIDAPREPVAGLWGPRDLAIGPDGNVYVADTGNKRVRVYSPIGDWVRDIGEGGSAPGQLDEPAGLVIHPDGRVFVADTWNRRVSIFQSTGEFINSFTVRGWSSEPINRPYLALDVERDYLYVTDPDAGRVLVYDTAGNCVGAFGQFNAENPNSGQFSAIGGIATDQDGNVYVTDLANGRILRFAPFPAPPPTAEGEDNMDDADNSGAEDVIVIPNDENEDTDEMPPAESTIELAFPEATDEVMPSEMTDEVDPPETTEEPAG